MSDHVRPSGPEVSCTGKERMTHETAKMVAKKMRGKNVSAYRCKHCSGWHVGSLMFKRNGRL